MAHEIDIYVGNKIRMHRHDKGFSQTDLGEAIGVKFQQIQKYECAANRISASRLALTAQTLEMPIWEFFPLEYSRLSRPDDESALLQLFRSAPPHVRKAICETAAQIAAVHQPQGAAA